MHAFANELSVLSSVLSLFLLGLGLGLFLGGSSVSAGAEDPSGPRGHDDLQQAWSGFDRRWM